MCILKIVISVCSFEVVWFNSWKDSWKEEPILINNGAANGCVCYCNDWCGLCGFLVPLENFGTCLNNLRFYKIYFGINLERICVHDVTDVYIFIFEFGEFITENAENVKTLHTFAKTVRWLTDPLPAQSFSRRCFFCKCDSVTSVFNWRKPYFFLWSVILEVVKILHLVFYNEMIYDM